MMRWIPDWVVYALVLGVVLWVVFSGETDDAPPPPPEAIEQEGAMLPPPSAFDERVLVQVTAPKSGVGTAFAINGEGQWLTARHVVDGCNEIALLVAPGQYAPAARVIVSEEFDLALIDTDEWQLLFRAVKNRTLQGDNDYNSLLRNLFLYEYRDDRGRWVDINPVLAETEVYQQWRGT